MPVGPIFTPLTSYHGVTAGMIAKALLFVSIKEEGMEFGIAGPGCQAPGIALTGHGHDGGAILEDTPRPYSSLVQEKMT